MANLRETRMGATFALAILIILIFLSLKHSPSLGLPHITSISISRPPVRAQEDGYTRLSPNPMSLTQETSTPVNQPGERLAFVTWLSSTVVGDKAEDLDHDVYFIGTRILVWQLLHNPKTKAQGIDVIVAVTPDVSESRRARLLKDGAIVRPIDFVHGENDSWLHPKESRWGDIMSKLRIWEFTEYDRIAMLDGDIILQHRLDGVFKDPGAQIARTLRNVSTKADEPAIPDDYLLASIGEVRGADHSYPPTWEKDLKKPGYFCAGFFLLRPSRQLFAYYTALLSIPHRFSPEYMEQNLLNYAHRWDGPMPWKEVAYTWNIRSVNDHDLDQGVVSMHEKWWEKPLSGSERVTGIFQQVRWEMEGWYKAKNALGKKEEY